MTVQFDTDKAVGLIHRLDMLEAQLTVDSRAVVPQASAAAEVLSAVEAMVADELEGAASLAVEAGIFHDIVQDVAATVVEADRLN